METVAAEKLRKLNNAPRQETTNHVVYHMTPRAMKREDDLDDTALHEAEHAAAALATGTGVEELSLIPNYEEGYAGYVKMDEFNAVAAAAPAAFGRGGTSHDLMQIRQNGYDVGRAKAKARTVLTPRQHHVLALATAGREKGILGRKQIKNIFDDTENPRFVVVDKKTGVHTTHSSPTIPVEKLV